MDLHNVDTAGSLAKSTDLAPQLITVSRCDRWQIYHRLQELDISCRCLADGRIEVAAHSFTAELQLWSVLFQQRASRAQLANVLERSWVASA